MIEYQDRLRQAMSRANLSPTMLARAMGLSYQAVKQVLDGKSKAFSAANNARAALALDVDASWLATGLEVTQGIPLQGVKPDTLPACAISQASYFRPLVSLAQVAAGFSIKSVGMNFEVTRHSVSQEAFFLVITGDSTAPEFRDGDCLLIEPRVAPEPGDYVVAIDGARKKAYLSRYRLRGIKQDGDDIFELVPLNDYYPTIRSEEQRLSVVGTVVELRRQFRKN